MLNQIPTHDFYKTFICKKNFSNHILHRVFAAIIWSYNISFKEHWLDQQSFPCQDPFLLLNNNVRKDDPRTKFIAPTLIKSTKVANN
jgi:hypothetical protein